jgi:hypothetical protein
MSGTVPLQVCYENLSAIIERGHIRIVQKFNGTFDQMKRKLKFFEWPIPRRDIISYVPRQPKSDRFHLACPIELSDGGHA